MKYTNVTDFIKEKINVAIDHTIDVIHENNINRDSIEVVVERNKNISFGDFSTKFVLSLGLPMERAMEYANEIASILFLGNKKYFSEVKVIKPGFINFKLTNFLLQQVLIDIINEIDNFGIAKKTKLNFEIEFVSANPTGLLHIGHARNAAIGDTLARIWEANGIHVTREYYINDAGNQMEMLAMSVLVRYKQLFGQDVKLPEDSYHAEEIITVASKLKDVYGDKFLDVEFNETGILPEYVKQNAAIKIFSEKHLLQIIRDTLKNFGVSFDIWFSETELYKNNLIKSTMGLLSDHCYVKEGATWLKTTEYGDDKDRVLVKSDGQSTYFLPDIAYHNIKLSRGYNKIFNIWGADHTSYADRMNIAMKILGHNPDKLVTLIMQMVRLVKDGKEFKMSKRSGNSLTLDDLVKAIGKEPARWYLVSQPMSSHLEIDVDKATNNNNNNPLYYVQYAHARINQILSKIERVNLPKNFDLLTSDIEREIIVNLHSYVTTIRKIASSYEVNILTIYLYNLAKLFHSYYASNKIIDLNNMELTKQRYWLAFCIKTVIANGLALMDIKAVNKM